jgi:UDP-N-acetylmuramoyl-L-alanyl-D-glutamate--2,6-diaminopimelate ligase
MHDTSGFAHDAADDTGTGRPKEATPLAGVRLSTILPGARFIGCDDISARGGSDVASRCRPGDVFVAHVTTDDDAHAQVMRAVARGVSGVIAERMIPTAGAPLCIVPDAAWAEARLAHALCGDPARRMRVIGVTGTSGKTTTAWLTAAVLAEGGSRIGVLSDLGCLGPDDDVPEPRDLSRPSRLAAELRRLAAVGCTHVVVEVSSRQLAAHALAGVPCDTVVVTNIARAHLDEHGTAAAYRRIKARILDALGVGGCLVADGDGRLDGLLRRAAARSQRVTCLTAGLRAGCDVRGRTLERSLGGQTFLTSAAGQTVPTTVTTPVRSFMRDALLATAVGLRYGIEPAAAARAVEAAAAVPGRMERLDRGQDVRVFIDSATSGHALATTLGGLRRLTAGRLVVVAAEPTASRLAGRGRLATRVERWCDACLVVPASLVDEPCDSKTLAAYARIDRLFSGLRDRDCVVVLDGPAGGAGPGPGVPLSAVIDGWLHLAQEPVAPGGRRRVA